MARENREFYREMLMNAILFIPIGLTMPHILPQHWKTGTRVVFTVVLAMVFSMALESLQYLFSVGTTEVDDVIFNTLGALIGMLQLPMISLLKNAFAGRRSRL